MDQFAVRLTDDTDTFDVRARLCRALLARRQQRKIWVKDLRIARHLRCSAQQDEDIDLDDQMLPVSSMTLAPSILIHRG